MGILSWKLLITMKSSLLLLASVDLSHGLSLGTSPGYVRMPSRPTFRTGQCRLQTDEQTEDPASLSPDARKVYNKMRAESGVELAPWMKIDTEAIARAEKARKDRKAKAAATIDPYAIGPQAAELSGGGGLSSKVISEEEVQLTWSTGDETGNAGFIVQRRKGGKDTFEDIASFESFAPLKSKGPSGGDYRYLDDAVPSTGTWVYRILDCDTSGMKSAVCQKLVEVDAASEKTQTLVVGGFIALLALVLVGAGIFIDPIQTTSAGRGF